MISLLSWLWNRAARVYYFFGSLYNRIRSAALNAFNWAVDEANKALERAKAKIAFAALVLRVIINQSIAAVRRAILDWIDEQIAKVRGWISFASIIARILINAVKRELRDLIDANLAKLIELKDKIEAKISGIVNAAIFNLIIILLPLILLKDKIKALITTFDGGLLDALIDFFNRMYIFLSNFVERPLGMILGMLQGVILTFLSWVIGYAMGTEKYKLPPWPSWDEMEIPGPSGPNPRPPDGSGSLGKPLAGLYISGHRYGSNHRGVDFGLTVGTKVFAAHDARVEFAGWSTVGYGNTITLRSGKWWTRYAHLSQISVTKNQRIDRGQVIGRGGSTGNSSGPHLHFEVKHRGKFVDPLTVLNL